ncbi:hypothetical protein EON65_22410 [archaeon]|nr:MAG: hypothetical protein EON65_22410 [archaeon]
MAEFGEDFGQKVDLTASIRNILRNYPEGTAIFKELIQNADDAGATTVSFCFDNRHHDASNLPDPRLAQFQGPSLLVYNNAVFSKEDLQSIQRIGDSLKNMDEQAKTKIGRFGIGFNAVYHWTELPSFITDRYLVMLDPQARFLPNVNPANPGKLVDWIANRKLLANFKDQFSPYALPGMDWSKPYAGTLFRLPLRTDDQAASSFLSKRSVNPQEMLAVLQTLASEASSMLLFLRTVSAIEVTVWNHGDTSPTRLYECHIRNMNSALQKKRSNDEVLGRNRPQYLATQVCLTQDFTLEIEAHDASSNSHTNEKWEVCTQFGGGEASVIASDPARAHLKLVPLGGVAANVLRSSASESLACEELGKAYCFLPLPVETGLSVMVNGFFELSSNRRDIWQESADMTGDGMARARWNLSLLRDVLAPCYTRLLVKLRDDMKFSLQYQKLWPKFDLPHPWCVIGNTTLVNVKNEKLLLVNIASTYSVWIEPARAVLLPLNSADTEGELIRFLQLAKAPVVTFQCAELHNSLVKGKLSEHVATPYLVRRLLKNSGCIPLHDMCRFLLAYVLSDLTSTDSLLELNGFSLLPLRNGKLGRLLVFTTLQVQSIAALLSMGFPMQDAIAALLQCKFNVDNASELLASNAINPSFLADSLFFMAPQEDLSVFKAAYSMIVDTDALGAAELERFRKHDFSTFMNLRFFAPELLSNLLRPILPRVFFEKPIVSAKRDLNENERVILAEFIPLLWKYLEAHPKALPPLYDHVSILPANSHADFCSISRMSNLIMPRKDDNSLPSELSVLLQRLKLRVVDQDLLQCDVNIFPASVWDYVHPPSLAGICASLSFCERDLGNEFFDLCDSLTPEQRDLLWNFFVSYARGDLTGKHVLMLILLLS